MASIGETIYEDYLFKFTGRSRSILWGKTDPWKQRYFILKRVGNRPILEYFNKKTKSKNATPRGKLELFPSYRVEKITNMKNRAYVFQITTPTCTLCLSAEEQRCMDMFVFFIQIQSRLKDQIREDYIPVHPENSEAQRRIGAKGTNSVLHVSPYGVTLALQSNRAVLAQWPLKSIRCYESSGGGQLSIEAGRVAPMGDGLYIFQTRPGDANGIYDLLDQYVMDTVGRAQPDRHGNDEEIEDYVIESERLLALTVVAACTSDSSELQDIVQNNWNTDLNITLGNNKPHQVVHTRLTGASSASSLSSQNSITNPPALPARNLTSNLARNSPQVSRTLPSARDSPAGSRKGSATSNLADRPPLPPPINSGPVEIPARQPAADGYLRMNSSTSRSTSSSTPQSPWTPTSADWVPPPTFKEVMRQKSQSPLAENGPYRPESYLSPSKVPLSVDSYLSPTTSGPITSTPVQKSGAQRVSIRDAYITPSSFSEDSQTVTNSTEADPIRKKDISLDSEYFVPDSATLKRRMRRLRSVSCDDLTDYLKSVVYDPVSKSMNDLLEAGDIDDDILPEPFPRLQTFSGSIELCSGHTVDNYYNIEGLHGKIYDGPGLTVGEIRKKFSHRCQSSLRRSMSNPNFIGTISNAKLQEVRVKSGYGSPKGHHSKKSLTNLLPDALKKHLSKENLLHSSQNALSNGGLSSKNSSHASSANSSRRNSLSKTRTSKDDVVSKTSVKGINVTKRSRSFRRQKACDEGTVDKNAGQSNTQNSNEQMEKDDNDNNAGADNQNLEHMISQDEIQLESSNKVKANIAKKAPSIAPKPSVKPSTSPKPSPKPSCSPTSSAKSTSSKTLPKPSSSPKPSPKPSPRPVKKQSADTRKIDPNFCECKEMSESVQGTAITGKSEIRLENADTTTTNV